VVIGLVVVVIGVVVVVSIVVVVVAVVVVVWVVTIVLSRCLATDDVSVRGDDVTDAVPLLGDGSRQVKVVVSLGVLSDVTSR